MHSVVASPPLEVPSAERGNPTTDRPVANHVYASPGIPGIAISLDYFDLFPVTPRGNIYIGLITDRFCRRPDMFAVTPAEFTAEGTANILVKRYVSYGGSHAPYSRTTASSSAPNFHKLSTSFCECAHLPQAPFTQTVAEALIE